MMVLVIITLLELMVMVLPRTLPQSPTIEASITDLHGIKQKYQHDPQNKKENNKQNVFFSNNYRHKVASYRS